MPAIAASGQVSIANGVLSVSPSAGSYFATSGQQVNLGTWNPPGSLADQSTDIAIPGNVQAIGCFINPGGRFQKLQFYGTGSTRLYRDVSTATLPFYIIPWANILDNTLHVVLNNFGGALTLYFVGYYVPPANITIPGDAFATTPTNTATTPLKVVPPYALVAAYDTNLNTTTTNWTDDAQQFTPSSQIITLSAGLSFAATGLGAAEGEQGWIGIKGVNTGTRVTLFHFVNVQYIAAGAPWNINWYDRLQLPASINTSQLGLSGTENWVLSFKSSISGFVASAALLYGVT